MAEETSFLIGTPEQTAKDLVAVKLSRPNKTPLTDENRGHTPEEVRLLLAEELSEQLQNDPKIRIFYSDRDHKFSHSGGPEGQLDDALKKAQNPDGFETSFILVNCNTVSNPRSKSTGSLYSIIKIDHTHDNRLTIIHPKAPKRDLNLDSGNIMSAINHYFPGKYSGETLLLKDDTEDGRFSYAENPTITINYLIESIKNPDVAPATKFTAEQISQLREKNEQTIQNSTGINPALPIPRRDIVRATVRRIVHKKPEQKPEQNNPPSEKTYLEKQVEDFRAELENKNNETFNKFLIQNGHAALTAKPKLMQLHRTFAINAFCNAYKNAIIAKASEDGVDLSSKDKNDASIIEKKDVLDQIILWISNTIAQFPKSPIALTTAIAVTGFSFGKIDPLLIPQQIERAVKETVNASKKESRFSRKKPPINPKEPTPKAISAILNKHITKQNTQADENIPLLTFVDFTRAPTVEKNFIPNTIRAGNPSGEEAPAVPAAPITSAPVTPAKPKAAPKTRTTTTAPLPPAPSSYVARIRPTAQAVSQTRQDSTFTSSIIESKTKTLSERLDKTSGTLQDAATPTTRNDTQDETQAEQEAGTSELQHLTAKTNARAEAKRKQNSQPKESGAKPLLAGVISSIAGFAMLGPVGLIIGLIIALFLSKGSGKQATPGNEKTAGGAVKAGAQKEPGYEKTIKNPTWVEKTTSTKDLTSRNK